MADKDLWSTFERTGSVVDYLNYKGIHTDAESEKLGEKSVESVSNRDRNDTVRNTYR